MKRKSFWIGAFLGAIVVILIGVVFIYSGIMPMTASGEVGLMEHVGNTMWERSLWRAPDDANPFANDASVAAHGFEHYRAMCVHCHGAPNVERAEWAKGLHPLGPDLTSPEVQNRSDGALFYIVRNGVRGTGMPAFGGDDGHSDGDIWHIVAWLRVLGGLTEAQEESLREGAMQLEHDEAAGEEEAAGHEHGEGETHEH